MKFLLKLGRGEYSEPAGQAPSGIPQLQRQRCLVQTFLLEHQSSALELRNHPIARDEIPAQDALRQRILDLRLDGALQRTRPIHRVESRLADPVARVIVEEELNIALRQPLPQAPQLDVHDGTNLFAAQRMEHHDVVHPVDELRAKMLGYYLH